MTKPEFVLKPSKKPWSWYDPIYRTDFLLFSCTFEDMQAWTRRALDVDLARSQKAWGSTYWIHDRSVMVIWLNSAESAPVAAWNGLIAHEAMHATNNVLLNAGLQHTNESDEAYAYYTGWLVEEMDMRLKLKPAAKNGS